MTITGCNVCMEEDDLEKTSELISCGNEGCTFEICASCAKTYYGSSYRYTRCPQCRRISTGDEIEELKPPNQPVIPAPVSSSTIVRRPFPSGVVTYPLVAIYFAIFTLVAWLMGAGVCAAMGFLVPTIYQIIFGIWGLGVLVVVVIAMRGCYELCE